MRRHRYHSYRSLHHEAIYRSGDNASKTSHVCKEIRGVLNFVGSEKGWGAETFENQFHMTQLGTVYVEPVRFGAVERRWALTGTEYIFGIPIQSAPGKTLEDKIVALEGATKEFNYFVCLRVAFI